jgi:hypothetical protein
MVLSSVAQNRHNLYPFSFFLIEQIAEPATLVNGKMNRLRPPLTSAPALLMWQTRGRKHCIEKTGKKSLTSFPSFVATCLSAVKLVYL